jgi:hypothetical protein
MSRGALRASQIAVLAALFTFALASGSARATAGGVMPNQLSLVDCNGWSPTHQSLAPTLRGLCTDPIAVDADGDTYRATDNGRYVGHDEPSVKFISSSPNSGNTMTYLVQLGADPKKKPTPDGTVTDYAELSNAPWFGLAMCDPRSYPQNPCTPDSDTNSGAFSDPNGAGSALMELQFYPPGFGPAHDGVSCDPQLYCAALTIDSVSCTFGFATCNNNCFEPVNRAYIQRDGVPTGPPSPQLANEFTLAPNSQTLLMKPGDPLRLTLTDTPDGFKATVDDLRTHQSGFMVASAANGFMNTNIADCSGTPFTFHPEYDTAAQQNQVPWAALETGVMMEQEVGHFESCDSVANPLGGLIPFDLQTYFNCVGGLESGGGEGPCDVNTGICQGATTENGAACPTDNARTGALCEFSDAVCIPQGPRVLSLMSEPAVWSWPVAGCLANGAQNGDLDFDGNSYRAEWPDGSSNHPQPFNYAGPFDASGKPYPTVQLETNVGGSEILCNTNTGAGCTVPPTGAAFYPFWTLGKQSSPFVSENDNSQGNNNNQGNQNGKVCLWNFGNRIAGVTTDDLGNFGQYGTPNLARFGGTSITAPMPNPQLNASCTR